MPNDPWDAFPAVGTTTAAPVASGGPAFPGIIAAPPKLPAPLSAGEQAHLPIEQAHLSIAQKAEARQRLGDTWTVLSPDQAKQKGLDPSKVYQVNGAGEVKEAGSSAGDPAAYDDAKGKLTRLIKQMNTIGLDANDNGGWFETGTTGSLTRSVPGTAAYDLQTNLQTLNSNFAFEALQAMRNASKTGGALGQISDKEEELLRSTVANLDPNQSQASFLTALASAKDQYLKKLEAIDTKAAAELRADPGPYVDDKGTLGVRYQRDEPGGLSNVVVTGDSPNGGGTPPGGGIWEGINQGTGSIAEGLGNMVGIVGAPLNATINSAFGTHLSTDFGTAGRQTLGLPKNVNPVSDAVIQGGTGALTGSLGAGAAAARMAPGVVRGALSVVGATPIRDAVAGAGAAAGGIAGRATGIPGAALVGNLLGGMGAYGGASGTAALTNLVRGGQPTELAQAATRQGVELLPADAGGPIAKIITTGTKASPFSVAPVVNAAKAQQGQMGRAVQRAAMSEGEPGTTEQAGQSIREAAQRFTKDTSARASRLYDTASKAAQGVSIKPLQTLAKLDDYIGRLQNNPAAPNGAAEELARFRDKIAGGVNVAGLRDARTSLSQGVYDGKLRSGADQAMWKDILGNLSSDIDLGLRSAGREGAANSFKRADTFWRDRVDHIDQVLQPILGKDRGGEQIVQSVESMARGQSGGNARLSRLLAQMTPEEAGRVRSVVIDRIGRANPGGQDAEGHAFSPATFLTNWNKMTPQAKASLFGDSNLRSNLNDIAKLAEGMKASQAMANHSNTAAGLGANIGLQGTFAVMHPLGWMLGAGAQYLTGKLMASPAFASVLARTAKQSAPVAARTLTQQLGIIAAREPAIAMDAGALQRALTAGANDNTLAGVNAVAGTPDEQKRQARP